jgi:hypothetical protein
MGAMELKTIAKAPRRLNVEYDNSVTQCRKCRTVEPEEHATARQWCGKHISMEANTPTTIEELWKALFFAWSVPRLYNKDQWDGLFVSSHNWWLAMNMEAEESPLLKAATKKQPVKTEQTKNITSCCTFNLVSISFYSLTCKYDL